MRDKFRCRQEFSGPALSLFSESEHSCAEHQKSDKYSEFVVFEQTSDESCPKIAKFPRRGRELTVNSVEIWVGTAPILNKVVFGARM